MKKFLEKNIKDIEKEIIKWRRHIHKNPELSNQEKNTSEYIAKILENLGINYERQNNNYGIIAKILGKHPGKKIAFRADMDALPVQEKNEVSYKSQKNGIMHACGHDAHMAILLGTAKILKKFEKHINGEILLIFQPAEEASPQGGAKRIIASKALEGIDRIYGLHVWPEKEVGKIVLKKGPCMAASDHFFIDITGKAGHAAEPDKSIDALVAAANWIVAAQSILSREISPMENIVFSIGTMNAGVRYNVVAENVKIEGTCRTFNPAVRDFIEKRLSDSLNAIDNFFGTKSSLDYERGYCSLINDEEAVEFAKEVFKKYIGEEFVIEAKEPSMCAEDFAFYLNDYKGAFFWLGTGYEGNEPLHNPKFNIDESILKKGVLLFSSLALEFLK